MGLTKYCLSLFLLASSIGADAGNDSSVDEHRVPRVSGRIVKVYSGNRPEPYMCSSEGYKSDPYNCASFYRCVKERNGKFNVFRYQCAPGTVYDPDLETCNHPRSTKRTECGGIIKPIETIDLALANQIDSQKELFKPITMNEIVFIKETTNTESTKSPWFTSQSKSTKSPKKTTVFQTQSSPFVFYADTSKYNSEYNNYVMSTNQPWISSKEENDWSKITSSDATSKPKNDDICSDDGFTGDVDNCRKFYRCVGNQRGGFLKYEFFCSETTVWDEAIQSCNHPWAVKRSKCGRSMSFADKSETSAGTIEVEKSTAQEPRSSTEKYGQKIDKSIQQQLQISHGSKIVQTQTQISHSDQVIQNQTQINYGDRITKNKVSESKQNQTQIAHGSAVSQTQTQIDYGNKGMQTQLQIDHSKDSSQSQTQIHESTTLHTTTYKQDDNQNNTSECSESGFIGDSKDCKKFYRCVDSSRGTFTKYEYVCGEGTVWDQSIEACNHAWAVKECGGQSHSQTQSSTAQPTTILAGTTTTTQSYTEVSEPDTDDNDVGYGNQGQTETTTSVSTTSSKTTTSREPQYETTKEPQREPNNDDECKSNGFMGDSYSCKKFYRCVDNGRGGYTRHEFTCGEGTVWDPSIEACNHAWAVEKCGGTGSSSISSQIAEQITAETSDESTTSSTTTQTVIHTTTVSSSTSTTTSTESNESHVCKNSGFIGDDKNCKKFYRCVDNGDGSYTQYEFTCGEGTVWDSKIEACNHEWAVETCGGNSESTTITHSSTSQHPTLQDENIENEPTTTQKDESSSSTQSSSTTVSYVISATEPVCSGSGFVGDKNNCKKFYRCVENGNGGYERYEFSCGEGTVWDDSISACNHAWAVKECGANGNGAYQNASESIVGDTASSTETENKEETSQYTTEKSTSTTGNPTENEISDGDCESEGFYGSMSDCKKFIRCVDDGKGGFTKYEFNCGEGTTWNQHIQACDHPSPDRPCGQEFQSTTKESHINDEMATETTTKMTTTSSEQNKEESEVTQKPQLSSGTCETEGFNGDPSNCKKFYRCVDDGKGGYTKYEFTCGDGTVWNQEILACDHESDDKSCFDSGTRPTENSASQSQITTSGSQSESTTNASPTTDSSQETDKTDSQTTTTSSDKCTSDGFFAHPHDCKKFVRCVNNGNGEYTRYEFSCGEGTIWVQEIQACDHDNGELTCSKQSESTTKPQELGSSSATDSSYSSSTESQTPNNKEDDEYPQSATQQTSSSNSDECTSEGYFANNNDCRKFYRCVVNEDGGYTKYDFVCGEGTAWDSNIGNCNHINEVASCKENNNQESHTQQTMKDEEVPQSTEGTSGTTQSTSSSPQQTEETETGSETGSNDRCETEGYFGDSKDCKKFYRCVDDGKGGLTKYDFNCGEGTIWDQDITNCNHPQDVSNPSCKSGDGGTAEESQTSSTSSTTSSPESTTSSNSSDNSTQSSSNCTQGSSEKPASSKDISCEEAGYYANPNDCKKFYRCVDWDGDGKRFSVYHFECGEGTIWDPALDTCNHEESVYPPRDCSQTQAQNESSSEGTTTAKQEETTTQNSSTSEQSTTQESTTSEQTTTEQEQTTTQQLTSEKTTTQQSTTSDQTTTQQSTTSELTTTQQSTTSEQTTTQETATSEQTTTQQSTTSEQTTTQQSTTSEQTTTQQSTTSEQTTTQQSTTSEQITTQESTTSEQTTQETTTSEQTTEQSTTSEQTTTEENSETTESSTTEGTTESSTTEAETDSTTDQSSTTEGEQESTTQSSSSEKECPETEDDQYLFVCPTSFKRHPKYCNMFYQCTEDDDTHEVKIATFKCPNDTIYDESQTQCVEEDKADKKCDGEMARRHRFKRLHRDSMEPITVDKVNKSCPSVGYHTFEKTTDCSSGFLKCERNKSGKIRGYVYQCPEGYLFWAISKRCELAVKIRDCNRSTNDWKGRWNIPVDRKNVAF